MQGLFSEHWHSVRALKPRLRDGVSIYHRSLRGTHWVLLYDRATDRFHRLTPQAYRVVSLLDGRRTLDQIWELAALADEAPDVDAAKVSSADSISQHELVQLLGNLHSVDLLQSQVTPDAAEVLERYRRQRRAKFTQSLLNPLSIRVPLLYPEPLLQRQAAFARALASPAMLLIWFALVIPAVAIAVMNWSTLTFNLSDRILSAKNILLVWLTFPVVKAFHEYAHALTIKAWGGTVREMGVMFVVFTPVPYVDATASYGFSSKWQRAFVAAAGIMAELLLCALALYVWSVTEQGWVHATAFNVILIAGVSTLLVNGNPLMRYDGYFVLTDLIEIPNLAQRSSQYSTYLIDRHVFGSREAEPPIGAARERWWLMSYGAVSAVYRISIALALSWFVAEKYFFLGVLMALAGLWGTLFMPLWRGWKHLRTSPSLGTRRDLALRRTLTILAVAGVVLAVVPLPFYVVAEAVTRLPEEAYVRAGVEGHVAALGVAPGETVGEGQLVLTLDNPQLAAEAQRSRAAVDELTAQLRLDQTDDRVHVDATRHRLEAETQRLNQAEHKLELETVRAGTGGEFVVPDGEQLIGQYFRRGQIIGYIVGGLPRTLRAALPQEDVWLVEKMARHVEVRLSREMDRVLDATIAGEVPGGSNELVAPALGTEGGGAIPVDPSQQGGTKALNRIFTLELQLDQPLDLEIFGDRAYVRFDLGWRPLAWQWVLRLRQLLLSRLYV